jgi:excisionase family DNA binding protein
MDGQLDRLKQLPDRLAGPDLASTEREDFMTLQAGEKLLSLTDVSEMLGIPVHTLYRWRHNGDGPAGYRVGRHVRYRREAVEAWLEQQADKR